MVTKVGTDSYCLFIEPVFTFDTFFVSGILLHIEKTLAKNGHCTIVLAEGTGATGVLATHEVDESGNVKLPEIGVFIRDQIKKYFKEKVILDDFCTLIGGFCLTFLCRRG